MSKIFNFKGDVAVNGKSLGNSISAANKRLTNLNHTYSDSYFITDATAAYQKTVPSNALPYAEIESVDDSVTVIKSLGGNKVLSDEAVLTPSFQDMTVTNLGGGSFQFVGYTSWQDNDYNYETQEYNKYAFWSFPLKAGSYKFSTSTTTGNTDDTSSSDSVQFALTINGKNYGVGIITITEDVVAHISVSARTAGNGQSGYIGSFEIIEGEPIDNLFSQFETTSNANKTDNGGLNLNIYTTYGEYYEVARATLPAGTYNFSYTVDPNTPQQDEYTHLKIGTDSSNLSNVVTLTAEGTIGIYAASGGVGELSTTIFYPLVICFEPKVIGTLTTPLGEDNLIAVEPVGVLVFENEGNNAVPSIVTYMLDGKSLEESVSAANKRLINLNHTYSDSYFTTDATTAYQKTVPENALPYAEIESVDNSVTAIKSFSGNKVLAFDSFTSTLNGSMTVTNLGGGRFQFDGYTSWRDSDYNQETEEYNSYTFLTIPLKAGVYKVAKTKISTGDSEEYQDMGIVISVNDNKVESDYVVITEDSTLHLKAYAHTGMNGQVETVLSFEVLKVEGYENAIENYTEFISDPTPDLMITDLGGGNFQLDGYTEIQGNWEVKFLTIPLSAGQYYLDEVIVDEGTTSDYGVNLGVKIDGDGKTNPFTITEDAVAEVWIDVPTGSDEGASGAVVNISLVNQSVVSREVLDTLTTPLGEDNLIAVEPVGTLVFENAGSGAVSSTVTYMVGEDSISAVEIVQTTGDSETAVMSQKAVTDELNNIENEIDKIQENQITPQMYGAKGNGSANDTNAFYEALEHTNNLYLPEGTYVIDFRCIDLTGKTIRGANTKKTIIMQNNSNVPFAQIGVGTAISNLTFHMRQNTQRTDCLVLGYKDGVKVECMDHRLEKLDFNCDQNTVVFHFDFVGGGCVGGVIRDIVINTCEIGIWVDMKTTGWLTLQRAENVNIYRAHLAGVKISDSDLKGQHTQSLYLNISVMNYIDGAVGFDIGPCGAVFINPVCFIENSEGTTYGINIDKSFATKMKSTPFNVPKFIGGTIEGYVLNKDYLNLVDFVNCDLIIYNNMNASTVPTYYGVKSFTRPITRDIVKEYDTTTSGISNVNATVTSGEDEFGKYIEFSRTNETQKASFWLNVGSNATLGEEVTTYPVSTFYSVVSINCAVEYLQQVYDTGIGNYADFATLRNRIDVPVNDRTFLCFRTLIDDWTQHESYKLHNMQLTLSANAPVGSKVRIYKFQVNYGVTHLVKCIE